MKSIPVISTLAFSPAASAPTAPAAAAARAAAAAAAAARAAAPVAVAPSHGVAGERPERWQQQLEQPSPNWKAWVCLSKIKPPRP